MMFLVIRQPGKPPERISLSSAIFSIGREEGNDLRVEDPRISRAHARIVTADDGAYVINLGSSNANLETATYLLIMRDKDVLPMLQRVPDWKTYLLEGVRRDRLKMIRDHEISGLPLGYEHFVRQLERRYKRTLVKQKPGPKYDN